MSQIRNRCDAQVPSDRSGRLRWRQSGNSNLELGLIDVGLDLGRSDELCKSKADGIMKAGHIS